jgi:LssY C-terminus
MLREIVLPFGLFLTLLSAPVFPQTASGAASPVGKDYSFTVPTNQAWTDTGPDLLTGDLVQITSVGVAGCGSAAQSSQAENLPLPSAPAGSLIAKLHDSDTKLLAVNSGTELHIQEPGRLYLGVNGGHCSGSLAVKVHVVSANSGTNAAPTSEGEKYKQELGAAAQIFLQGQFGLGNTALSSGGAADAVTLKVSDAPLDSNLRREIDGLPRRVNDQFKNLGDMVNFVLIGSESQVKSALDAANWHVADTSDTGAVLAALTQTYEKKDYLAMPMSTLYLFGRPQDYGYEMAEPIAMVASRHHFRLWKTAFLWNGQNVWVGAGTHDIGFAKDKRNGNVTHKIDPAVDGERTNIGQSLDQSGKVKSMSYYLPPNPVQDARNATGDGYHSDGRILVVFLK